MGCEDQDLWIGGQTPYFATKKPAGALLPHAGATDLSAFKFLDLSG
jgi:hypothetical protein